MNKNFFRGWRGGNRGRGDGNRGRGDGNRPHRGGAHHVSVYQIASLLLYSLSAPGRSIQSQRLRVARHDCQSVGSAGKGVQFGNNNNKQISNSLHLDGFLSTVCKYFEPYQNEYISKFFFKFQDENCYTK